MLFPLGAHVDVTTAVAVDYDDRDLRDAAPASVAYRLTDAPIDEATFWKQVPARPRRPPHPQPLAGAPGQPRAQAVRPGRRDRRGLRGPLRQVADERADAELAKLRDKYEAKATHAAQPDRRRHRRRPGRRGPAGGASAATTCCRRPARSSAACSAAGGRAAASSARSAGPPGAAAGRRRRAPRRSRRRTRSPGWTDDLEDLEAELVDELTEIDDRWKQAAGELDTMSIALERTDVKVTQLTLAWIPTA